MNYPDLYVSPLRHKVIKEEEPQKPQLIVKHKDKKIEDGKIPSSEKVRE